MKKEGKDTPYSAIYKRMEELFSRSNNGENSQIEKEIICLLQLNDKKNLYPDSKFREIEIRIKSSLFI